MHTLSSFLLTVIIKDNSLPLLSMTQLAQVADGCQMYPKIATLVMTPAGYDSTKSSLVFSVCFSKNLGNYTKY